MLGDQFTDSLNQSVTATVKDIEGKVRRASYEIVNIVKDLKTQRSPAVRELSHPQPPIQQLLGQYGQKKTEGPQ